MRSSEIGQGDERTGRSQRPSWERHSPENCLGRMARPPSVGMRRSRRRYQPVATKLAVEGPIGVVSTRLATCGRPTARAITNRSHISARERDAHKSVHPQMAGHRWSTEARATLRTPPALHGIVGRLGVHRHPGRLEVVTVAMLDGHFLRRSEAAQTLQPRRR
jgi:prepilin-type processing-associated H-X9-DG protein